MTPSPTLWNLTFLDPLCPIPDKCLDEETRRALVILNQPFSPSLLRRLWNSSSYRCCADGGANWLHDILDSLQHIDSLTESSNLGGVDKADRYLPDLIAGDLDSIRPDVQGYYTSK